MNNPFDEIKQDISDLKILILKLTDQRTQKQGANTSNRLLSFKEAHQFLQIAPSTLYKYVGERKITFYKSGKHLRFWEKDLIEFNNKGRHDAI